MAQEPSTGATPTEHPATSPEAAGQAPETAAAAVDYNALLDSVPEDVLRRHSRFNGYAGRLAQQLSERDRDRIKTEEFEKARAQKEAELMALAEENPFEFSQRYLKDKAKERVQLELADVRTKAQSSLFEKIASSYSALPEWQQLSPEEFARVQQQVAGKADDELVAAFNVAALDVLSERRARTRADKEVRERLESEVEARLQQRLAERLRGETTPDMSLPVSANGLNGVQAIRQMSDKEFDDFYNRNFRV